MSKYDYQSNWVSVSDFVPPKGQDVLVTYVTCGENVKTTVGVAHVITYDPIIKKSVWTGPGRVTHWMPLPAAAL